jgi:Flp pilus assembly protein CpaB
VTKGQSLVIALALILTAPATAVVHWYPSSVEEPKIGRVSMVAVVVSKVDIPAGTDLDRLIKERPVQTHRGAEGCRGRLDRPVE